MRRNIPFINKPVLPVASKTTGEFGFAVERMKIIKPTLELFQIEPVFLPGGTTSITQAGFDREIMENSIGILILLDNQFPGIPKRVKRESVIALQRGIRPIIFIRSVTDEISESIENDIKELFGSLVFENDLVLYKNANVLMTKLILRIVEFSITQGLHLPSSPDIRPYQREYPYKFNTDIMNNARCWAFTNHRTSLFLSGPQFWSFYQASTVEETNRFLRDMPIYGRYFHTYDQNATCEETYLSRLKGVDSEMKKLINLYGGKPGVGFGGISEGFTIPSCGADGSLLLIMDDDSTRFTCTFDAVPYDWVVDNILPKPSETINWVRTSAEVDELYGGSRPKSA